MKQSSQPTTTRKCPFNHWDSGFLSDVKWKVEFIRSPHAKIYTTEEITLDLVRIAQKEFEDRWEKYEFGQSTFRDLVGSIGAICIRGALLRYRANKWSNLTRENYRTLLPETLKICLEEEATSFFSKIPDGQKIHGLLDVLSQKSTSQIHTVFDKKLHLRGANFIQFIKESQVSTAFRTLDKIFMPLCDSWFSREKFEAIIQDSGLHLLRDIAWWGNHLEHRIIAGTAALGRPPALTELSSDGEALQFQISPHQLFEQGHQMSHFSCGALFQAGNKGYKNLFEEFILTIWETYWDIFCE
jgi:hypothetical protein